MGARLRTRRGGRPAFPHCYLGRHQRRASMRPAMTPLTVKLPDGSDLELADGATGADAATAVGPGLARAALAMKQDGELRDLAAPLAEGTRIEVVTDRSAEA